LNRYGGVKNDSFVCKSLLSSKDIELTVLKARKDAEEKLNALGIRVDGGGAFEFDSRLAWKPNAFSNIDSEENIDDECEETNYAVVEDVVDSVDDDFDNFDASVLSSISNGNFNDYTSLLEKAGLKSQQRMENNNTPGKNENGNNNDTDSFIDSSSFALVTCKDERVRAVRKYAIVWALENGVRKLSNDRSTMQSTSFSLGDKLVAKTVEKRKIRIRDWCVF
jgi:hypothetical protein